MKKSVMRQHESTSVTEFFVKSCDNILGVSGVEKDEVKLTYILVDSIWYRVFIDVGVLFLEPSENPVEEDDLEPGEKYIEIAEALGCIGSPIKSFDMSEKTLNVSFETGKSLVLQEIDGATKMKNN